MSIYTSTYYNKLFMLCKLLLQYSAFTFIILSLLLPYFLLNYYYG